jgi:ACT domain-containing protein
MHIYNETYDELKKESVVNFELYRQMLVKYNNLVKHYNEKTKEHKVNLSDLEDEIAYLNHSLDFYRDKN